MSHQVTITRTVTTTNQSAIIINSGYLKSPAGILKLLQLIIGGIIIGTIVWSYEGNYYNKAVLFMLLMATAFFICSFCLLLSCIFSLSTGGLISKTLYEFIYHLTGAILLFIASILLFLKYNDYSWNYSHTRPYKIASTLGIINAVLYVVSTVLAHRAYRY